MALEETLNDPGSEIRLRIANKALTKALNLKYIQIVEYIINDGPIFALKRTSLSKLIKNTDLKII
jgi:hypothetical protein